MRTRIIIVALAALAAVVAAALVRTCHPPSEVRGFGGVGSLTGGSLQHQPDSFTNPISAELVALSSSWAIHQIVAGVSGAGNPDGADGVDMADFDGDGRLDVVTGHEQGLRVTLSFNPGPVSGAVESPWPTVTLPNVNMGSSEDAIACDVDKDGTMDIVSASETGALLVDVFFGPAPPTTRSAMLNQANWTRASLSNSAGNRSMKAGCGDLDGDGDIEIVVGGKDANGVASSLGYYSSTTPRTAASWTYTSLVPVGWVMQMYVIDFDADTDLDIVYSDKVSIDDPAPDGSKRGLRWLRNDGGLSFSEHQILLEGDHKWFSLFDADADGDLDIADCRSSGVLNESNILINTGAGLTWTKIPVTQPSGVGQCQQALVSDVDLDGKPDLSFTYSNAQALSALVWLRQSATMLVPAFARGEIAGVLDADSDTKMDNGWWADVDGDGDMDLVTTEQHIPAGTGPGLGIIYAENPRFAFVPSAPPPGIACAALTSGTDVVTTTTAVTASVTPGANRVVYAAFMSALAAGPAAPTGVAGNGLTWVQVASVPFHTSNARRITAFRALGASPSAGAITATWAVGQTSKQWSIIECSGVDTSGTNGSGATVQSVTTTATAATTVTNTLAALAAASSVHLAWTGISNGNTTITPDADFVELTDTTVATGVGTFESQVATNQTPVTPTWASSGQAGVVSIEVRAAP